MSTLPKGRSISSAVPRRRKKNRNANGGRERKKNNAASLTCFGGANKDLFGWLRYGVLEDVGRVSVVCHQFGQKADIANGQTQRVHLFF